MTEADKPVRTSRVRRFFLRLLLLVVIPLLALVFAVHFYFKGGRYVTTENAYVKSHIVAISADIDGRVVLVNVADNQRVEAGDLLFRIDPTPFALRVAEAEAEMAMAQQEVESLQADYRESRIAITQERENVRFFTTQFERQQQLQDSNAGSVNAFDEAQHNLRMARQRVAVLDERATQALARLGGSSQSVVEQHPSYLRAKTRRDQAAVELAATTVIAPSAGIVSNMQLQTGEYVNTGIPVFSLLESDRIWVQANLKETQLTHLQSGQSATLVADAYPDYEWQAAVASIAPATGAEFALLPPQNATGNWVKIVQRIPVELTVESQPDAPDLRAGMTVSVKIDTNRQRQPPDLIRAGLASELLPVPVRQAMHQVFALDTSSNKAADSVQQAAKREVAIASSGAVAATAAVAAPGNAAIGEDEEQVSVSSESSAVEMLSSSVASGKPVNNNGAVTLVSSYDASPAPLVNETSMETGKKVRKPAVEATDEHTLQIDADQIKREAWLARQAHDQFTIQVSSSDDLRFLQRFARQLPSESPAAIYHYKYSNNGQPEYGLASGLFDSRSNANKAISNLTDEVQRYGPWVRRIGDIQRSLVVN